MALPPSIVSIVLPAPEMVNDSSPAGDLNSVDVWWLRQLTRSLYTVEVDVQSLLTVRHDSRNYATGP